jgi:signal transduction histidine kinase
MKYLYPVVCFLLLTHIAFARTGLPAQEIQKAYEKKIATMVQHCNILLGSDSAIAENYPAAILYAQSGFKACKPDDAKSRGLFALFTGLSYYNTLKFDSALSYFNLAYTESLKASATDQISWASSALIPLYQQRQNFIAADSFKNKLQAIVDTTKDWRTRSKGYYGLGTYYYSKSYYATSQDYILKGLDISKKIVDTAKDNRIRKEYALNYYLLYKLYTNTQLYDKGLDALRKGSLYMHASPMVTLRYYASFVDAYTGSAHPDIDSALYFYAKLRELPKPAGGISSEEVTSSINIGQYYMNAKRYDIALPFINRSDSLATVSKSPFLIHQVQSVAGRYAYYTGQYDKAIALLEQSSAISKNINKGNYVECLNFIALAYKAKGNTAQALAYFEQFDAAKDSLNKEQMIRNFADLEIRYRTKEKEQEINALNIENKISVLELKNANRLKFLLIAGLIAISAISVLLYRIYRNKSKLNRELNERNNELDRLNVKLALANDSKARLFGIFSHDLRSPVSKIAQFLRLQKAQPELFSVQASTAYHEKFVHSTDALLSTMEDLLIWSKSQMESFKPEFQSVAIRALAGKEISLLKSQIEDKHIRVEHAIPESLLIKTDENFMSIILRNLLQNAVRYSEASGTITLMTTSEALIITNTSGLGLGATELNELLQKKEVNSNHFGLGLQIARDLVERIGARLSFHQEQEGRVTARLSWN